MYLVWYPVVFHNLCKCGCQSFAWVGRGDFDDIQEETNQTAVVLEMDSLSYKRAIVGGAPGIRSKIKTTIVFLAYGECYNQIR